MNYSGMNDWRTRRNLLNHHTNGSNQNFSTRHYSIFNYSTEEKSKSDMKNSLGNDIFIGNLHMIKDPLKKNLADSLVTEDINPKAKMAPQNNYHIDQTNQNNQRDFYPSLAGIGNFISGVFNVISGAMFHKRARSPVTQYYDCFDNNFVHEESPALETWQPSKCEVENKNGRANEQFISSTDKGNTDVNLSTMTSECRTVAGHCENKINQVRLLLSSKASTTPPKFRRRPRRKFVESGSVEDTFEDAFAPEDFEKLANDLYIQCVSPCNCQNQELLEADAPIIRTEFTPVQEKMDIVKSIEEIKENVNGSHPEIKDNTLPIFLEDKQDTMLKNTAVTDKNELKQDIISCCEDKVSRLKALLLERRKKNTKTIQNRSDSETESAKVDERAKKPSKPVSTPKVQDKHYKNPHRLCTSRRNKSQMLRDIQDDMIFADEIDCDEVPSIENSPASQTSVKSHFSNSTSSTEDLEDTDYFNEVTGRFHASSTAESDDSFQIVFNDSPPIPRPRKVSDCDSEDSFIVFEDSPDSCYTSNDVFGDDITDIDSSDSDSDSDINDSGCGSSKLTHSMTKTFGDLTDDSLYEEDEFRKHGSEDEVDNAGVVCEEISANDDESGEIGVKSNSLLLDEAKKKIKKKQPPKKVHFSPLPPKVHVMRVWAFAARQARIGNWERLMLDRDRFKRRIADVDMAISWVLKPQHRTRIMFQRFMPWWNAQKRKELAEKKERQMEEEARMKVELHNVNTVSDSDVKEIVLDSVGRINALLSDTKCAERLRNCSDKDKNRVCTKSNEDQNAIESQA